MNWRLSSAVSALAAGWFIGPWVGGFLLGVGGSEATMPLLAIVVAATCVAHSTISISSSVSERDALPKERPGCPDPDGICANVRLHLSSNTTDQGVASEQLLANA